MTTAKKATAKAPEPVDEHAALVAASGDAATRLGDPDVAAILTALHDAGYRITRA